MGHVPAGEKIVRTGILLSVREKATRLPGKVLLPLGKYNVTEHLVRRLMESQQADLVVVSTSNDPRDEVLVDIAKKVGVEYFKGSEDDKLRRYRDTARHFKLGFVVIVDGDDPFCSVEHIDKMIDYVKENPVDYIQYGGLPLGASGFGVDGMALERICEIKKQHNTEVWQHLFHENPIFKSIYLKEKNPLYKKSNIRMTLDYEEDYEFVKTVVYALQEREADLNFANIMKYLKEHPEATEINQNVQEKYEKHLQESRDAD